MKDIIGNFESLPYKRSMILDVVKMSSYRFYMEAYAEIDVTVPREIIEKFQKETGEKISFAAFIAHCIGKAVSEHKEVHALRKGKKVIVFDDVDIMLPIERIIDGKPFPTQLIVRKANEKSVKEIHNEVRGIQFAKDDKYSTEVSRKKLKMLYKLPSPVRQLVFWRRLRKNPFFLKKTAGTIQLVTIGMFGKGTSGWGVNLGFLPVIIVIGGIAKKPRLEDGKVVNREYLNLTVKVDHEMVDGAPATRFGSRMIDFIVNGSGLEEFQ